MLAVIPNSNTINRFEHPSRYISTTYTISSTIYFMHYDTDPLNIHRDILLYTSFSVPYILTENDE